MEALGGRLAGFLVVVAGVILAACVDSGTAAKYSAEAQPIFCNSVLYVPTG